jgi:outer membrane protein OmpA-like peptidoglycan-associated protein
MRLDRRLAGAALVLAIIAIADPPATAQPAGPGNNGPPPGGSYDAPAGTSDDSAMPATMPAPGGAEPMQPPAAAGELQPQASEPEPEPVPQPQPAEAKEFSVYFNAGQATLTPEGSAVVQEAVAAAKQQGATRVSVVGYTDASQGSQDSLLMSERSAKAVADALVAMGVSRSALKVEWKGKADLAVETADGVAEPQNRRVTITLDAQP